MRRRMTALSVRDMLVSLKGCIHQPKQGGTTDMFVFVLEFLSEIQGLFYYLIHSLSAAAAYSIPRRTRPQQ